MWTFKQPVVEERVPMLQLPPNPFSYFYSCHPRFKQFILHTEARIFLKHYHFTTLLNFPMASHHSWNEVGQHSSTRSGPHLPLWAISDQILLCAVLENPYLWSRLCRGTAPLPVRLCPVLKSLFRCCSVFSSHLSTWISHTVHLSPSLVMATCTLPLSLHFHRCVLEYVCVLAHSTSLGDSPFLILFSCSPCASTTILLNNCQVPKFSTPIHTAFFSYNHLNQQPASSI